MSIHPNILLILVDGLRADCVYKENSTSFTPTIDFLQAQGTSFLQMVSTTSTTTPSIASLLTGLYPSAHGIRALHGYKLADRKTYPEVFQKAGYYTRAEVTGPLRPELGLGRGFDDYVYRSEEDYLDTPWGADFCEQLANGVFPKPWFLFVHLWELHVLWRKRWLVKRRVSRKFNVQRFGASSYERALSQLDEQLGKLLKTVNFQETLFVLTSDHGERIYHSIKEEQWAWIRHQFKQILSWQQSSRRRLEENYRLLSIGHGFHVYEDLIRIPLILSGNRFPPGRIIKNLVRQIDILPTLADILGLVIPHTLITHGRSLMPLIRREPWEDFPAYIEATGRELLRKKDWRAGLRTPRYKFIFGPDNPELPEELYDLESDPYEEHSLVQEHPDLSSKLKAILLSLLNMEPQRLNLTSTRMSPEEDRMMLKQLKRLGYMD